MAADDQTTSPHPATGLPGFPTWRSVYVAVLGCLALWVALLTLLPRLFP